MKANQSISKFFLLSLLIATVSIGGTASALSQSSSNTDTLLQPTLNIKLNDQVMDAQHNKQITKVSNALAISSIVKHLELNLDRFRFVKEPKATDYFTNMKNDAWYSNAFLIAHLNGIDLSKSINPSGIVTREQFSYWLYQALTTTGDYSWQEIYMEVKDNSSIKSAYRDSIQKLLIAGIVKLDNKQQFGPTQNITYSEVLNMLQRATQFIKEHKPTLQPDPYLENVTLSTVKVTDDINKVILTAEVGHPGYGIEISSIEFKGTKAYISYRLIMPDPDKIYPQVITDVTATTYISSAYEAVIAPTSAKSK